MRHIGSKANNQESNEMDPIASEWMVSGITDSSKAMTRNDTTADQYYYRACAAIQFLDEMGGPDAVDYISVMQRLAEECSARAKICEVMHAAAPAYFRAGFRLEQTGGGCTAYRRDCTDEGTYILVTVEDDSYVPTFDYVPVVAGLYAADETRDENTMPLAWIHARNTDALLAAIAAGKWEKA